MIDALEQVSYWHQAHSFVRGNWRCEKETSPMIIQKCCHDLDLLQYYADSTAETVYSVGSLTFFTHANMPRNAATHCKDCPLVESCPYSAERVYVARWKDADRPLDAWSYNVVATTSLTEEKLRLAYENGPYGNRKQGKKLIAKYSSLWPQGNFDYSAAPVFEQFVCRICVL